MIISIPFYPSFSWRRAFRVWQRNFTVYLKYFWSSVAAYAIEPIVYLIGMGIGVGVYMQPIAGLPYLNYIAPGLVASSAMFATSFECTYGSYIRMTYQRTFDAIIATPVSVEDVIVGELLWGMAKSVFYGSVILAVIFGFGVVQSPYALLLPLFLVIPGLLFAICAVTFTAVTPSVDFFNYYLTLFVTPMFFFSGIFFPLSGMPPWVGQVAAWTPLYHVVKLSRSLVLGDFPPGLWLNFAWLFVATVLLFPIPIYLMKRRLVK